jgi:hypothetical protein
MSACRIVDLACAALFLSGFLVFAWTVVADHDAVWAGLMAFGCLLLMVFALWGFEVEVVCRDNRIDR